MKSMRIPPGSYTREALPEVSAEAQAMFEKSSLMAGSRSRPHDAALQHVRLTGRLSVRDRHRGGIKLTDPAMKSIFRREAP